MVCVAVGMRFDGLCAVNSVAVNCAVVDLYGSGFPYNSFGMVYGAVDCVTVDCAVLDGVAVEYVAKDCFTLVLQWVTMRWIA